MLNKRAINLKKKLKAGAFSPGIWVSLPSPTASEVIANAGFDWVIVDAEHSPFNPETLQHMLMAFKESSTAPLIRVPWNDHVMIKQALDMDWDGVVVPQTNSAEEVRRAVAACRYPPVGRRGFGPRRAGNYYKDQEEYVKLANESVICVIQIEDVAGAEQIDEIVRVPGIDWIIVGACDMSGSVGRFLDIEGAEIWKAVHRIFDAARSARIPTGNAVGSPTGNAIGAAGTNATPAIRDIRRTLELGCQLVFLGEDTGFLKEATDNVLKAFHDVLRASDAAQSFCIQTSP